MALMSRPNRHRLARTLAPALSVLLLASLAPSGLLAADVTDEVLVRFRDGTPPEVRAAIARQYGLSAPGQARSRGGPQGDRQGLAQTLTTERYESTGRSLATLRRLLEADPNVVAVAPNGRYELAVDPSGPTDEAFYDELWGLHNRGQTISGLTTQTGTSGVDIDGLQAFAHELGDPDLVVAVIDDGIDFSHPDLADRAWTNPGESGDGRETNGIDDDANGFVDDVHGWDFCNGDKTVYDANQGGHGTHVAGTIAASRNGIGTVGVAPGIQLMALKFITNSGCGMDQMAIDAVDYAARMGAHLINASWGGPGYNEALETAIRRSDALFVAAAGNYNADIDQAGQHFYPASFTLPNVVSVAAIDQRGNRAAFSNYGHVGVDIAAPGTNILSTWPANPDCASPCYVWSAGTSMAAPHVTGVAALIGSRQGSVLNDPIQLKARLLATGTPLASTAGLTVTGDLVNAYRGVDPVAPVALPVNRHGINVGTVITATTVSTSMTWPAASDDLSGVATYWLLRSADGGSWGTITSTATARSARRDFVFGTEYRFRLRARDRAGNIGPAVDGQVVKASLVQEGTSLATYGGTWATASSASASGGKVRYSTTPGSSVEFAFIGRSIGIVAPKSSTRASVKVYVDGVYVRTVSLHRSTGLARVVVYATSWATTGPHRVKLVTVATSGRTRVDIDAAVILK